MNKRSGTTVTFFLFILIALSGGCYTRSGISKTEVSGNGELNCVILHTSDSVWVVAEYSVSGNVFKGVLAGEGFKAEKRQTAYLYAAPPDAVTVEGRMISVPLANIARAEVDKINKVRTFESVTLGVLAAIPVLFILTLLIGGGYDM